MSISRYVLAQHWQKPMLAGYLEQVGFLANSKVLRLKVHNFNKTKMGSKLFNYLLGQTKLVFLLGCCRVLNSSKFCNKLTTTF
jgi:hypothetical protein